MVRTGLAAALLLCLSAAGCASQDGGDASTAPTLSDDAPAAPAPTQHAVGKYEQTWKHPYQRTTCAQFSTRMNAHQRFVAAADMLSGARDKGDGGHGVAPDALIRKFIADIDDACSVVPTQKITQIAVGIYLTERAKYEP